MAEIIGTVSGLVSLATFAGQCSVTLYETVASYQSHQQRVRDLVDETSALSEVLGSLADTARANPDLQIPALTIPLKRCARACQEFEQEIKKFSSRSDGSRTSFRDWARLRYMGEDVDGFRRLLSGYKMTITIALTDASMYVVANIWLLRRYKSTILIILDFLVLAADLYSRRTPSKAIVSF